MTDRDRCAFITETTLDELLDDPICVLMAMDHGAEAKARQLAAEVAQRHERRAFPASA